MRMENYNPSSSKDFTEKRGELGSSCSIINFPPLESPGIRTIVFWRARLGANKEW